MLDRHAGQPQTPARCLVWSAYALFVWSVAYGALHALWALGIATAMLRPSAAALPVFAAANWITAVLLVGVGLLGLALLRLPRQSLLSRVLLFIFLCGCSLSTSHGIYGIINRTLQVRGVVAVESEPFNAAVHAYVLWDLFLFEPWFAIEGVLLAVVGWCYLARSRSRRIWLLLCCVGVIAGLVTGLLGVRIG